MRFTSAFIYSFLFASVVLALRTYKPQPLDLVERSPDDNSTLAGAIYNKGPGTFNFISAGFRVPHFSTPSNSHAVAVVAIDGTTCHNAIFRSGVYLSVDDKNIATFTAFSQWYPADMILESALAISAGDNLYFTVTVADSAKSGTVKITNFSTREFIHREFTSDHALCGQDAQWLISRVSDGQTWFQLPDFDKVTFIGAQATGPGVDLRPQQGAKTVDIVRDGLIRTWIEFGKDALTVHYNP